MESTPPELGMPLKQPDPEKQKQEEEMWGKCLSDFENGDLHKTYVGFCIRNGLMVQAAKRYGKFMEDKENQTVENRRIARNWNQQLAGILFVKPTSTESLKTSSWEKAAIFLSAVFALGGLAMGGFWLLLPAIAIPGLGLIFYLKYKKIQEKMED